MHRARMAAAAIVLGAIALGFAFDRPRAVASPHACGEASFAANGVTIRVLFARNDAVQQYLIASGSHNQERDHDALLAAQARFGPEAIDAPPVRVVTFKSGPGGMMIPDKAVDSCGRVTHFH